MYSIGPEDVRGKRVLGLDNGQDPMTLAPYLSIMEPSELVVLPAGDSVLTSFPDPNRVIEAVGAEPFNVVYTLNALDNVKDWKRLVKSMENILAPGGLLVIVARSPGPSVGDILGVIDGMKIEVTLQEVGGKASFVRARRRLED
jgi:hypothetical protein